MTIFYDHHLWPVVGVVTGVGPGLQVLAVRGVEAGDEAVVAQHLVKVLHPAARVQLLNKYQWT